MSNRSILKCSFNGETQKLFELTSNKNVKLDCIINDTTLEYWLERHEVKAKYRSILSKEFKETTWNDLLGLKKQPVIVSSIVRSSFAKDITNWQNVLKRLPVKIHNFAGRYLIFNWANNCNLFRWKILPSRNCNLCLKPQTQLHIFKFCERTLDRFTWRHNSILSSLCNHLNKKLCHDFKIVIDLTNYENPGNLFKSKRPDIVI